MIESDCDLAVIGGGINGAAIAREAARRGLRVLLLEQADFGSGTSSASTRLIHGGLRYLEHGEIGLVRESLHDREALLEFAPHLVEPLGLHIPIYAAGKRSRWQIAVGLKLYDWLAPCGVLPNPRMLSRAELLAAVPGLSPQGLNGGALYFDAQATFPERLVIENIIDAVDHGTRALNYARVTAISAVDNGIVAVEWQAMRGQGGRATTRCVVNAAGPWVDDVLETMGEPGGRSGSRSSRPLIGGTKGSHLVLESFNGAPPTALYTEAHSDGRPFFVIPWNGLHLIGTTDLRYEGNPAEASISDDEFAYLVEETERLFPRSGGVAQHVVYTQSGVRPLPYAPGKDEGAVTRRHLICAHARIRGLYSVVGGKLTTHRSLARDMLDRVWRDHRLGRKDACDDVPLPGALGPPERDEFTALLERRLGAAQAFRLWHTYGRRAEQLLVRLDEQAELRGLVDDASLACGEEPQIAGLEPGMHAGMSAGVHSGMHAGSDKNSLLAVELVHALETEWATSLVDILQRRAMVGLGPDFGLGAAAFAARTLCRLGHWDRVRAEQEWEGYLAHARQFRVRALAQWEGKTLDLGSR